MSIFRAASKLVLSMAILFVIGQGIAQDRIQGFNTCADTSGTPFLCAGPIPETELDNKYIDRVPGDRGCGTANMAWGANNYEEIPGIFWAYLRSACENGLEFTIWTDFTTGLFGGNSLARSQGREIQGTDGGSSRNSDGKLIFSGVIEANAVINYEFIVNPDGEGSGQINGEEFDLVNGTLFLIASDGPIAEIRQVNYNLANINGEDVKLLATRHEEIVNFYEHFHYDSR